MKLPVICNYFSNMFSNHDYDMPEMKAVLKLLHALNVSKAVSPGVIRPRILKELSQELSPTLILLFRASLKQQPLPG